MALHGAPIRPELLAEPDRRGVLQVGPAGLDDAIELIALGQQTSGKSLERREQRCQARENREAHRGRDHVVGALRHVDVIVRVHGRIGAPCSAEQLVGPVCEYLVTVHVVAGTRARLIHVHDELIAVPAAENFIGRVDDGVGEPRLESSALLVGQGRGALDPDDGIHEHRKRTEPRDREILRGTERLDAVQGVGGNRSFAQGIAFGAGGH
jgi:hypothetical protein